MASPRRKNATTRTKPNPFRGKWRIVSTDVWESAALDEFAASEADSRTKAVVNSRAETRGVWPSRQATTRALRFWWVRIASLAAQSN